MAVYKRGYTRYQGALTGRLARLFVLPRFAWRRLLEQRLVVILLVAATFWPLLCAGFIYVSNHSELLLGFDAEMSALLKIDGSFFVIFMNTQSVFAILLSSFAGPSLIGPDLANGALSLYFSRPMSRLEYVLARLLVLLGVLSVVTWIPGLLLFFMQSAMAGWSWFANNWQLGAGVSALKATCQAPR
jgi:ABC-2 type transport system permease protein